MKIIYITIGVLFAALGAVGTVFPVLPTTPFLLIAAWAFAQGSERFNTWFLNSKLYKNHLESFVRSRSMTLKTKLSLVSFASAMMLLSFFLTDSPFVKLFMLAMLAFLHYYFIFRIKTIK